MNLKTSLFNKGIIKSDLKRFWWISAVYMLLLAVMLPSAVNNPSYPAAYADEIYLSTDEGFLAFIFAFGLGGMLFSYLHKGNSASCLHALPVKKSTQYFSHVLMGALLLLVPIIIAGGVIGIECICLNTGEMFALKTAVRYMYTCGVYALAALLVTVFAAMLTGNTAAAYVFTPGFIILPYFAEAVVKAILDSNLYGYDSSGTYFSNVFYVVGINNMCSHKSLIYIATIVVLLFVNLGLYSIRSIENYEEIVAFKILRPVFMYTVAVCFGFFGCILINETFDFNRSSLFLASLPLGCAALIAAFMLNRKSFGIKGVFKPLIIFIIGVGIFKLAFVTDITGYERRVPNIADVESVEPYGNVYSRLGIIYYSRNIDYYDVRYKGVLTDQEDIQNIINLHSAVVKDKWTGIGEDYITLKYKLKNGRTLKRSYSINDEIYSQYMKLYYENEEYKKVKYPVIDDNEKNVVYVKYSAFNTSNEITLQHIDYNELVECIRKDAMALRYEDIEAADYDKGACLTVVYDEMIEYKGERYKFKCEEDLNINGYFKNTLALINAELPKYNLIKAEDIGRAEIEFYGETIENGDYADYGESKEIVLSEKEDIQELYNELNSYAALTGPHKGFAELNIAFYDTKGSLLTESYFKFGKEELPEIIIKSLG